MIQEDYYIFINNIIKEKIYYKKIEFLYLIIIKIMEELIITKYNINEFIEIEYITFKSNVLKLLVKVNKIK